MKITGARNEPFSAMRRRALQQAGAQVRPSGPVDSVEILGISEAEMTPAVSAAVQGLLGEIDDLRTEVGRLKGRLAEVEDLADRDALTPLLNRRALLRELGRIRTFAQRYGSPASLVYFDLDDLKGVNDRLGHAAGDAALKAVAERLLAHVRESDIVGRMGGDEFAVILEAPTSSAEAALVGSALLELLNKPLQLQDHSMHVGASLGIAIFPEDAADMESLCITADLRMYDNKRANGTAD